MLRQYALHNRFHQSNRSFCNTIQKVVARPFDD
jgi:hypothetical protein